METGYYYQPDDFAVLPAIYIRAGKCEQCDVIHGVQFALEWLWFGVFANYLR